MGRAYVETAMQNCRKPPNTDTTNDFASGASVGQKNGEYSVLWFELPRGAKSLVGNDNRKDAIAEAKYKMSRFE